METKHTPGPWTLETVKTSAGSCHKIGPFPGSNWHPDGTYACVYADGEHWLTERLTDRGKELFANARLITAAPELLETLQDFATQYACGCGHPACNNCERDREAAEVIAKATGEV